MNKSKLGTAFLGVRARGCWTQRRQLGTGERRRPTLALVIIAALVLFGCATSNNEMAWVRTDGRKIADDPALLQQGKADIALCHANLDAGLVDEKARACMNWKGYAFVRKDRAEEARAAYAAAAADREATRTATGQ
jgi:hypothetical protein